MRSDGLPFVVLGLRAFMIEERSDGTAGLHVSLEPPFVSERPTEVFSTDWRLTPSYGTEAAARRRGRCVAA